MANLSYSAAEIDERLGKTDDIGDLTELETTDKSSVVDAINELFTSVSDGKTAIAAAITDKGVPTAATDSFADMADNIADIAPGKNIQIAAGVNRATTSTLAAVSGQSITVAKSGKYDVYWGGFRSSTSGTSGSQLYKNNTAYGTENTTFSNHGQSVHLSNVSLNQGDVIQVYARSRGTNYYMYVSNLTIIEA